MKRIFFPIVMVASLLVAGCAKENLVEPNVPQGGVTVLTADVAATKTVLQDDQKVLWTNGDKINVNGVESAALELEEAAASATFTFEGVLDSPYKAVFPASIYKDAATVTLPAYQTYTEGSFSASASPMAAVSETSSLKFSHLCSVIKLTVNAGAEHSSIAYVDFYGKGGEQVSGDFSIDYQTPSLSAVSTADADKKIRYQVSKTLGDEPFVMYLVVPAQEYAQGYTIKVLDKEGHFMEQSKASGVTLEAGNIYAMPAFDFVPTGTDLDVEIATAKELIAFATAYNAGDYADEDRLTVALSQDIVFNDETSAAFAATGGIGNKVGENTNYFNGVFHGAGMTISGYKANVPLFAFTGGDGLIQDLTLAEDCVLTINPSAADVNHAPLVGRNKGVVKNCTSHASVVINNLQDVATETQYYGGIVGRNYEGKIEGCVVTGDITCQQSDVTITTNSVGIGGIAGSQAGKTVMGSIVDCDYQGNITVSDGSDFGGITASSLYFYVGGIAGFMDNGVISGCTAGLESEVRKIDLRGILVPAIGGIVSWVKYAENTEISKCVNRMSLSFASDGARGVTTPCRIGGIASRSSADISNCNNHGAVSSLCNSTTVYLAGIVGDGANVSYCTNEKTGTVTRTGQLTTNQSNRYIYMGGIMGANVEASDVDHCTNDAAILSNSLNTPPTNLTIDMGGIVGTSAKQLDIEYCVNRGSVTGISDVKNTTPARSAFGGILGCATVASTTVVECDNQGGVYCSYNTGKKNGCRSFTGGIAGLMGATALDGLQIAKCNNTGIVQSSNYNNTIIFEGGSFGGGIVGAINGTAASKASVRECTSSVSAQYSLRGINGGIAGYASSASLVSNTASQEVGGNTNATANAGIAGWLVGSTAESCTFSGTIPASSKRVGGLVYMMDATSTVSSCKIDGATLTDGTYTDTDGDASNDATPAAVLVSNAAEGATITNCGVKGTLNGEAITLESNMITTDGGATVTGTYLLD